jgi:GntR family transcriptional regulator, gluconate operon transcriptional repressor
MSRGAIQHVSLGDQVAHDLRLRIVRGQLAPGVHLVEDLLAEEYDVSRGPIRDALRRLAAEGLVDDSRRKGIFVTGLTETDVDELYSLREALETLALRLAMERAGPEGWQPLAGLVEEMRKAADYHDAATFARADLDFHGHIYMLSQHSRLIAAWRQYRPTFAAMLDVTVSHDHDLHEPAEDHARLLAVAERSEPDLAISELRTHLMGAHRRLRAEMLS